jgi:hypothetical protein
VPHQRHEPDVQRRAPAHDQAVGLQTGEVKRVSIKHSASTDHDTLSACSQKT